jgi:hypothetical protein
MSPKKITTKKLTDLDKEEIVTLYRQGGETTASLASRFGTSGSTINRLLKSTIPQAEYEVLVQQKRGFRSGSEVDAIAPEIELPIVVAEVPTIPETIPEISYGKTVTERANNPENKAPISRRRRSSAIDRQIPLDLEPAIATPATNTPLQPVQSKPVDEEIEPTISTPSSVAPILEPEEPTEVLDEDDEDVNALAAMFGEEIAGDDDYGEDDEDDEDEDILTNPTGESDRLLAMDDDGVSLRILPLSQAVLPRSCYITVDKFGELVIRPLKDFAELGQIPREEIQQRTLPIFDNQRVAKRFANHRSQKTIKIPDSRVLQKTASHLLAKGITRLLIDGKIYSLD